MLGCYLGLAGFAVTWLTYKVRQTWMLVKFQERLDDAVVSRSSQRSYVSLNRAGVRANEGGAAMSNETLQTGIEHFVDTWGPGRGERALRASFIYSLRRLMSAYAEAALQHGGLPDVGVPHGGRLQGTRKTEKP